MSIKKANRGYIAATLGNYCPRCREGKLFKNKPSFNFNKINEMYERCTVCGQPTEIEVGFYYGTGYVSYGVTVAISVATAVIWWLFIGFSIEDVSLLIYWLITNSVLLLLLMPVIMRLSRSLWISMFVPYDAHWEDEKSEASEERIYK